MWPAAVVLLVKIWWNCFLGGTDTASCVSRCIQLSPLMKCGMYLQWGSGRSFKRLPYDTHGRTVCGLTCCVSTVTLGFWAPRTVYPYVYPHTHSGGTSFSLAPQENKETTKRPNPGLSPTSTFCSAIYISTWKSGWAGIQVQQNHSLILLHLEAFNKGVDPQTIPRVFHWMGLVLSWLSVTSGSCAQPLNVIVTPRVCRKWRKCVTMEVIFNCNNGSTRTKLFPPITLAHSLQENDWLTCCALWPGA